MGPTSKLEVFIHKKIQWSLIVLTKSNVGEIYSKKKTLKYQIIHISFHLRAELNCLLSNNVYLVT